MSVPVQSKKSYIYIRGEYTESYRTVEKAIREAYDGGFLGKNILGTTESVSQMSRADIGTFMAANFNTAEMVFAVIGDHVTEINVTSPTGIRELKKKHGVDIGALLVAAIERKMGAS